MTRSDETPAERAPAVDPGTNERGASEADRVETTSVPPRWTRLSREEITAKLNEVLAREPDRLDPVLRNMQAKSIGPSDW